MSALFGADVPLLDARDDQVAILRCIETDVEQLKRFRVVRGAPTLDSDPAEFRLADLRIAADDTWYRAKEPLLYSRNEAGARVYVGEFCAYTKGPPGREDEVHWLTRKPPVVVKAMLSPTKEHIIIRALNLRDDEAGSKQCDRIPAAAIMPARDRRVREGELCVVVMAKAVGDLGKLRAKVGLLTTSECLRLVKGILEEVRNCWRAYGLLHMDVKYENFLFSRSKSDERAVRVVLSDYGGLAKEGDLMGPTFPPMDTDVPTSGTPASVKFCLYQFGPLLLQLMRVPHGADRAAALMQSGRGRDGIRQAYADVFARAGVPPLSSAVYAWLAYCSRSTDAFGAASADAFVAGEGRWFALVSGDSRFSSTFDDAMEVLTALISIQDAEDAYFEN